MIMMSVHYVYMHVNFTQYSHGLFMCCLTFTLNFLLWETLCKLPVSAEALASDSQTVVTDHQGALLSLLVPKCCPSVPLRLPSAYSTQDTVASMYPSVRIIKWATDVCTYVQTTIPQKVQFTSYQLFSLWADVKGKKKTCRAQMLAFLLWVFYLSRKLRGSLHQTRQDKR